MDADRSVADRLCRQIDESPSPYHAVATAAGVLEAAGYVEQDLGEPFGAGAGMRFVRRGGSLIAWASGGALTRFRVIGAHTDSPNLRIKPQPDRSAAGLRQLGVEVYGGALINSWLDRDLGLSGRVAVRDAGGPSSHLVRLDEPLLRIPQLAIHLDRQINTDGLQLNPQQHLTPIWDVDSAGDTATSLRGVIAGAVDADADDILSWDLMTHDLTPSRRTGVDGVFVSAPRLDNLCSSFAAVEALTRAAPIDGTVAVVCLYDHEEIGSTTATGADSALLGSVLERIAVAHGLDRASFHAALGASACLSADMAHATNPNYADRHEPDHHIHLNEGPVVKVNANRRYATDADTAALFLQLCAEREIPVQQFVGRNDIPCGSTIGPTTSARLGMPTLDVGAPQLAMHSARELCGADDPSWYEESMVAFLAG